MKILTLNCQRAYRREALFNFLSEAINSGEYDAIFLQEAPQEFLAGIDIWDLYTLVIDESIKTANGRVAVLVRVGFEIVRTDYSLFERQKTKDKEYFFELISVVARDSHSKEYVLASLHMPAYLHIIRRTKHFKKVLRRVEMLEKEGNKKEGVVAGGDWNSIFPYERGILSLFLHKRFRFVFPKKYSVHGARIEKGLFWNDFVSKVSSFVNLDYIVDFFLISSKVEVHSIEVLKDNVSDHSPVSIDIDFK